MTKEELISHYCDYRGKCTTDDVAALTFAYRMLAPRWISVEDELPPRSGDCYLSIDDKGEIWWRQYTELHGWRSLFGMLAITNFNVTHWMPTPQPPTCSEKPNNLKKGGEQ